MEHTQETSERQNSPAASRGAPSSPDIPLQLRLLDADNLYTISDHSSPPPPSPTAPRTQSQVLPPSDPLSDPPSPASSPTPGPSTRRVLYDEHGTLELSTDFEFSSPIRTKADSRRKAAERQRAAREERNQLDKEAREQRKREFYNDILTMLNGEDGCSLGGLLEYVSDPGNFKGRERYDSLFSDVSCVERILHAWVSSRNSPTGRGTVHRWAVDYVKRLLRSEGDKATRTKFLQTQAMSIDQSFALDFSMHTLREQLLKFCPVAMDILEAFSTTTRQDRELGEDSKQKKETCIAIEALIALGTRSQRNNYMKNVLGLYLYASGASRQVITVLSHLGITSSYTSLAGKYCESLAPSEDTLLVNALRKQSPLAHTGGAPMPASSLAPSSESGTMSNTDACTAGVVPSAPLDSDPKSDDESWYWDIFDTPNLPTPQLPDHATDTPVAQSTLPPLDPSQAPPNPSTSLLLSVSTLQDEAPPAEPATNLTTTAAANEETHPIPETPTIPATTSTQPSTRSKASKLPFILAAYGLLKRLSRACRKDARDAAKTFPLGYVYDNINMLFRIAEQILGRKDAQQNGTCATAFKLFEAKEADMRTADLLRSLSNAPPLAPQDILLATQENSELRMRLVHTVLRIIITYGGERFARFREDVAKSTPITSDKISIHKTEIFPLPAMNIDESSVTGNADVLKEIFEELRQNITSTSFTELVKLIAGNQLSISRIRSIIANRVGHCTFAQSFLWALCVPGLFHYKMTATHGLLEHHFGTSSTGNPGSLAFQNTVLDRKPIVISSLPPFRTCRDLIFVSAYARVLHCLELVSNCASLDEYAKVVDFEQLRTHAEAIVDQYANPEVAHRTRRKREAEMRRRQADTNGRTATDEANEEPNMEDARPPLTSGDVVFENAILFLRDALVLREFTDGIKAGDSGRVVLVLKLWALAFRGQGRTKYAHELLHLIHNLTHVWPEPLRKIVLKNWLVNPTGRPDAWVEVDLMQEHLNFWIKTVYKAHGSNASWEWLAMISPCIDILRRLATQINRDLGARQGSKHTSPSLEKDIQVLKDSLSEHRVYVETPGRVVTTSEDSGKPGSMGAVQYVVSHGWNQLAGPLEDFNTQFKRLQRRCRTTPLGGAPYIACQDDPETESAAPTSQPASESPTIPTLPHAPRLSYPTLDSLPPTSDVPVSTASAEEDDEQEYWGEEWDWDHVEPEPERVPFSLDSPGDVALDMDVIELDIEEEL